MKYKSILQIENKYFSNLNIWNIKLYNVKTIKRSNVGITF